MKVLSRDFTKKEKILIVILVIVILALCYYRFIHVPITDQIEAARTESYQLDDEQTIAVAKLAKTKKMQEEVEALKENGELTYMPSYNASKDEVAFLNKVLANASEFNVTFTDITRSGDQIRRNLSLKFSTADYKGAMNIVKQLYQSENRLVINDMSVNISNSAKSNENVSVSLAATFYETMVGGTEDAGLPPDSSKK